MNVETPKKEIKPLAKIPSAKLEPVAFKKGSGLPSIEDVDEPKPASKGGLGDFPGFGGMTGKGSAKENYNPVKKA